MCNAAGQLTDSFHLLRLPKRLLGLAPLGHLDRFGHYGDDLIPIVADGAHLEIKPSPASHREFHVNFLAYCFAACDEGDRATHGLGHSRRVTEPRRLPKWLAEHVLKLCPDPCK